MFEPVRPLNRIVEALQDLFGLCRLRGGLACGHAEHVAAAVCADDDALREADVVFKAEVHIETELARLRVGHGNVALLGQYAAAGFQGSGDAGAGTLVTYVPPAGSDPALLTQPQH